jgi:hypothetical protein
VAADGDTVVLAEGPRLVVPDVADQGGELYVFRIVDRPEDGR